ncbi:phosphoribosylamine--glycine ligase [Candidatus Curtissbacteria bacterium RIFCSPHIGHO2_01_FULL_41_44]|nr:MAG: phosphoribosylamine--glycine ligase [Candidatus Curtissbacteria bacterium RIFCSPHIGHO2_02_FULL_42_58]OGD93846.1 MAG: phosphoribosylamine--glycine ligase [Candidatus Curtissbacteria bacterium RIFCSPHIGHO2_01_FULL_41_44]OGD97494.1 MAG: phosphoribosylamine--glycine ligase [Candidatus Curtissbacteria bacterium RIFCSPHIGHO2_12_FULL_42_33]OGE03656.1 MAG: phosphoribosylamine--glycine ligase [Candidatus Curtissbacteria bacterium RIFCSPLOWO2_12_FULL_41_16]OGE11642.1 MAG: phosphoribosylamine--gly
MKSNATVLVIDGGGRGSVLVDKYLQSKHVAKVLAVPGNDLMTENSKKTIKIFPDIKTTDIKNIIEICDREKVDLIDVAQDDAVSAGLVDVLQKEGFKVFGPTKLAGQIEWDKAWSREFMKGLKIPCPSFKVCTSAKEGIAFIKKQKDSSWFIKASGLAGGKGALAAGSNKEAVEKIHEMKKFGKSGETFLIEEYLIGEEFSSFAVVGGKDFVLLGHAQDHKQVYDGDFGPNTGGMGCSSPPMVVSGRIEDQVKSIFKKTVEGLVKLKRPYKGILYLGAMVDTKGKVNVIEFNARWGDPEAQVIIPSIKNDFFDLANNVISGNLSSLKIIKDKVYRVVVTAASRGYPVDYSRVTGKKILGLSRILKSKSVKVFGAGVKKSGQSYIAGGGRLFYVMAEAQNVAAACKKAYNALSRVNVEGNNLHFRTDIGYRDLERIKNPCT